MHKAIPLPCPVSLPTPGRVGQGLPEPGATAWAPCFGRTPRVSSHLGLLNLWNEFKVVFGFRNGVSLPPIVGWGRGSSVAPFQAAPSPGSVGWPGKGRGEDRALLEHGLPLSTLKTFLPIPRTQMQDPTPVECSNQDFSLFMIDNVVF